MKHLHDFQFDDIEYSIYKLGDDDYALDEYVLDEMEWGLGRLMSSRSGFKSEKDAILRMLKREINRTKSLSSTLNEINKEITRVLNDHILGGE